MDDDERRSLMLSPGRARRTRSHFTANYSGDELGPVHELLTITRSAVKKATDLLASTQDEFDLLKQLDFVEDSPLEKRFFYLRWQNFALRQFIEDAHLAEGRLWGEMDNVFTDEEGSDAEPAGTVASA
jgi:hypothetical protein